MREKLAKFSLASAFLITLVAVAPVPSTGQAGFNLQRSSVSPSTAFFDSRDGVRIDFRFGGSSPQSVSVRIAGGGKEVRRIELGQLSPGQDHVVTWDGLTDAAKAARNGLYRVLVGPSGSQLAEAGTVTLYGHTFPVSGRHGTRGAVGDFGAGRTGGRTHQGFDVTARCGTPLVAARGGTVVRSRFDPELDGNFVIIAGLKERLTYRYSHLRRPSPLQKGDRVHTGDLVGHVGQTGNAGSTPCHLHIEFRKRSGRFIDPEPHLRAWDRYS
jgi:murein DD-endopeptidase MepM/ murein hydrolase activator NlpD